jgi:hypothetical protein
MEPPISSEIKPFAKRALATPRASSGPIPAGCSMLRSVYDSGLAFGKGHNRFRPSRFTIKMQGGAVDLYSCGIPESLSLAPFVRARPSIDAAARHPSSSQRAGWHVNRALVSAPRRHRN